MGRVNTASSTSRPQNARRASRNPAAAPNSNADKVANAATLSVRTRGTIA